LGCSGNCDVSTTTCKSTRSTSDRYDVTSLISFSFSCLIASNISSGASASPQYLRRYYVLFNFTEPAGLLTYGLRDYLSQNFIGRSLGGNVFRTELKDYGQCIILRVTGLPEEHEKLINEVLGKKNAEGQMFWEYTKQYKPDEWLPSIPTTDFSITQSSKGAIRGRNSDPSRDHPSEKSTQTGKSSQSKRSG
jgi:hypothetical protein